MKWFPICFYNVLLVHSMLSLHSNCLQYVFVVLTQFLLRPPHLQYDLTRFAINPPVFSLKLHLALTFLQCLLLAWRLSRFLGRFLHGASFGLVTSPVHISSWLEHSPAFWVISWMVHHRASWLVQCTSRHDLNILQLSWPFLHGPILDCVISAVHISSWLNDFPALCPAPWIS